MKKAAILSVLLASGAAALAQTPGNAPATTKRGPSQDQNEVVCISQAEIGSRLRRQRVCRTRAEWAEHNLQYRQSVERAQQQLGTQGN